MEARMMAERALLKQKADAERERNIVTEKKKDEWGRPDSYDSSLLQQSNKFGSMTVSVPQYEPDKLNYSFKDTCTSLPPPVPAKQFDSMIQKLHFPQSPSMNGPLVPSKPKNAASVLLGLETKITEELEAPFEGLRQMTLPRHLMEEFLKMASKNTHNRLETCGIICGKLKGGEFVVTSLLIPKQVYSHNKDSNFRLLLHDGRDVAF
jgi:hypothetical protein